jgi:YD repeat-containing protein
MGLAYDDLGRLSSETNHSTKVTSYKQDEAGNVYEKTNRLNEITRATYDNGNRVTRVDYLKDNSVEFFAYNAAGIRNNVSNAWVVYTMDYDRLNRITRKENTGTTQAASFKLSESCHSRRIPEVRN